MPAGTAIGIVKRDAASVGMNVATNGVMSAITSAGIIAIITAGNRSPQVEVLKVAAPVP
jgi:hypothetical protein